MIRFRFHCTGEGGKKGEWYFEEARDGMNVFDPDDRRVCWFPHRQANDRFTLPSFWRSVKNIGFHRDGSTVWFYPDGRSLARLKSYLDDAIAQQGVEAVNALRRTAWLKLLAGLGLIAVGLGGIVGIGVLVDNPGKSVRYPFAALFLLGLGQAAWGVGSVLRARRLSGMVPEEVLPLEVENE